MEIPATAVELVKKWEGLHKVGKDGLIYPYVCPAGYWTIGYGSTRDFAGNSVTSTTGPYTEAQCEELMLRELERCVRYALFMSPILQWNMDRLSAISSFIFNLGPGRYKASTLRKRINEQNYDEARKEIVRWVYAGGRRLAGLYARRKEEASYL